MTLQIPNRLGKYDVIEPVGKGSMGIVYRGHDPYIDRPVAIKVAIADFLKDKESGDRYRKMFFNEAHTAGKLQHPNILHIFDAGVEGDTCYIVMELVEGADTIKTHTQANNLLPLPKVAEIIFKCAKALDYAHSQDVVHRDIKPSNLLLTRDKDVKVADFSIAHVNRADADMALATGFVGSPRYMSPEQIQEETVSSQSDLFSLGIVMYEMLIGRHPFGGESFSKLIYQIVNEEHIPLWEVRQDLPEELERIIAKCLNKDLRHRYKSGLELAGDLSQMFSHLEVTQPIPVQEKFDEVRALEFFSGLSDAELKELIRAVVWEEHPQGDNVIIEGEMGDSFYILVHGTVAVKKGDKVVGSLTAGECFGEMAYLNRARRSATITASSPVGLMKINAILMEQLSTDAQLHFHREFLKTLIKRLSITTAKLVSNN
jgi:serine/threonine protein kinase